MVHATALIRVAVMDEIFRSFRATQGGWLMSDFLGLK
jgi:hypothetical protein